MAGLNPLKDRSLLLLILLLAVTQGAAFADVPGHFPSDHTDTFGKTVLTVHADSSYVRNTCDILGNLTTTTDELNQETAFTYDSYYRLATKTLPDLNVVSYDYDPLGNLTHRTMPGGLTWSAAHDSAGRMTSEKLVGGGLTNRSFSYTYYQAGNDHAGKLSVISDPRSISITNSYDDWQRLSQVTTGGAGDGQTQTTTYSRDRIGRTTNITQTTTGFPSTTVQRLFDPADQLYHETVSIYGQIVSQFSQGWNVAGRRSWLQQDGVALGGLSSFGYRADGAMTSVTNGAFGASFGYDDGGFLTNRTSSWRTWTITDRDSRGRATNLTSSINGTNVLTEALTWRTNSTLAGYVATRAGQDSWNETNSYTYNGRGQLTNETFQPDAGVSAANDYTFDGLLGILTQVETTGDLTGNWLGTTNGLGQLSSENWTNNSTIHLRAKGQATGTTNYSVYHNGTKLTNLVEFGDFTHKVWYQDLTPTGGTHTIEAEGVFTDAIFGNSITNSVTNTFTVKTDDGAITNTYDAAGNVIQRTLPGGETQTLTWDAAGRLLKVTERDGSTNGFDWQAVYDALGRRLRVTHAPVTNGVAQSAYATVTTSHYDPQVEFGEVGVSVNGKRKWKLMGPDLDGAYGGMQGIGGMEGEIDEATGVGVGAVNDRFGNVVASVVGTDVMWNRTRVTGYGPAPGYQAPVLGEQSFVSEVNVWRSRRVDRTGLVWMGARYYEPESGRFLSPDPYGHEASMSLYDYANGDPVNFYDPDGRWGVGATEAAVEAVAEYAADGVDLLATVNPNAGKALTLAGVTSERIRGAANDAASSAANWAADVSGGDRNSQGALRGYQVVTVGKELVPITKALKAAKVGKIATSVTTAAVAAKSRFGSFFSSVIGKIKNVISGKAKAPKTTPRISSKTIRSKWEKENGKPWPKDPATGKNQDVAHKKALGDGGKNDLNNVKPQPHKEHMQEHKDNGDFSRWAKRRKKKE